MMATILIRFQDAALDRFSWAIEVAQTGEEPIDWRQGVAQELGSLCQNQGSVVFIIPQQCVYLTRFEIPPNASRQVLSSIEYQIEDQLAQDVERQHVAIGDQSSNPVAIAVIDKAIMERSLELQQTHSLSVSIIIPELFLCPWSGQSGEVCLIESNDELILRYGEYRGLKCRVELLEAVLEQIAQQQEIDKVVYYSQNKDLYESLQVSNYPLQHRTLLPEQLKFDRTKLIDLQQREFQVSSVWSSLFKTWRGVITLMALMLVVAGFNKALALQDLETELDRIKTTQYELIGRYLPANVGRSENLKKALIAVLKQNQSSQRKIDFLDLLSTFTQAKTKYPAITIDKIGYQKGRLSIDVRTGRLSEIEALLETIELAGRAAVKLEKLDIKPEATSGRFVLTGDAG